MQVKAELFQRHGHGSSHCDHGGGMQCLAVQCVYLRASRAEASLRGPLPQRGRTSLAATCVLQLTLFFQTTYGSSTGLSLAGFSQPALDTL